MATILSFQKFKQKQNDPDRRTPITEAFVDDDDVDLSDIRFSLEKIEVLIRELDRIQNMDKKV